MNTVIVLVLQILQQCNPVSTAAVWAQVLHALLKLSSHQPIGSASSQHQRTGICRCAVTPHSLVPKSAIPRAAIICLLDYRIDPVSFSAGKSSLVPTPRYSVDSTRVLFPEALPGTMAALSLDSHHTPLSVRNWPFLKCPVTTC